MIRHPAFAGSFYPLEKSKLGESVKRFLSVSADGKKAIAGIVPHAAHVYSGATASYFYKTIKGQTYDNIIILCPNHTGIGAPISVFPKGIWETPMGSIEVNEKLASRIYGEQDEQAHLQEHSIEVQLPFLQNVLKEFKIVPVCIGNCEKNEMKKLGDSLKRNLGKNDLVIASSDFSHYVDYETAFKNDHQLIDAILKFDIDRFYEEIEQNQSACGYGPIAATMVYANQSKAMLLKYDTSATVTSDFSQVVGYASIVFF